MKKLFPIFLWSCCKSCKYPYKKSFTSGCDYCDINGIGIVTIIPRVLYLVNWCKLKKED